MLRYKTLALFPLLLLPLFSCANPSSTAPSIGVISVESIEGGYRCSWIEDVEVKCFYTEEGEMSYGGIETSGGTLVRDSKLWFMDFENHGMLASIPLDVFRVRVCATVESSVDDPVAYCEKNIYQNRDARYGYQIDERTFSRLGLSAEAELVESFRAAYEEIPFEGREYDLTGALVRIGDYEVTPDDMYFPISDGPTPLNSVSRDDPLFRVHSDYTGKTLFLSRKPTALKYISASLIIPA